MNWKNYVEKKNAKTYVIPPGWDSRETIAEQLECNPDKVDDHLRPSLRAGEVIKDTFRVWDDNLKRVVCVVAYREAEKSKPAQSAAIKPGQPVNAETINTLKQSGLSWGEVGKSLGITGDKARSISRRALRR